MCQDLCQKVAAAHLHFEAAAFLLHAAMNQKEKISWKKSSYLHTFMKPGNHNEKKLLLWPKGGLNIVVRYQDVQYQF